MNPLTIGSLIADRYQLERKLGAGGMGAVWLATDLSLGSTCAIKLVDPDKVGDDEVRIRFQREARAAAQIRSPNVVDVFDHGVWQGMPFIVMECLRGEDLGARLDRVGRLPIQETYEIVAQVARALTRAHALGIVHRDLKPENIFLVPGDDHEVAKVLDFGIAKIDRYSLTDKATKTGSFMGTPYYMSPEQARGRDIDWRSDLWGLSIIIFQCLTGRPPFESEALGELMGMILYDPIPKITDRDSSLAPELQAFWERAVARDREQRFQSAKELADALADATALDRRDVPSMPPRASLTSIVDAERGSQPPALHHPTVGSSVTFPRNSLPDLSDVSAVDFETGAPVSRTRLSVLPQLAALTPRQRKLAMAAGAAALLAIGFAVTVLLRGGAGSSGHSASDGSDGPVSAPAAPPVPILGPRLADAPTPTPAESSSAEAGGPKDAEDKKKDKKKRMVTPVQPAGPPANADYGI